MVNPLEAPCQRVRWRAVRWRAVRWRPERWRPVRWRPVNLQQGVNQTVDSQPVAYTQEGNPRQRALKSPVDDPLEVHPRVVKPVVDGQRVVQWLGAKQPVANR